MHVPQKLVVGVGSKVVHTAQKPVAGANNTIYLLQLQTALSNAHTTGGV